MKSIELTLKEFVELCNNYDFEYLEVTTRDKPAKTLGNCLRNYQDSYDEYDKYFYEELIKMGYNENSTEYKFIQDSSVVAMVNPFGPFVNMDEKSSSKVILRQKWHVLIAVLAYLDVFNGNGKKEFQTYNIGKIETIQLDISREKIKIIGSKGIKDYSSLDMNGWIFDHMLPYYQSIGKIINA